MMVNRLNQENQGNREEDQKPSFVLFAILNGVLAALVLASISLGIVLAVASNSAGVVFVGFFLYGIGIIVDLSAVVIGFIAVAKKNSAGIVVFLSVSAWQLVAQAPFVLITDIIWICFLAYPVTYGISTTGQIVGWSLVVLSLVRIVTFVVIFFVGLNLYEKVQRIDNTSRGRIVGPARFMANRTNGPQNQESLAQRPQNQESLAQRTQNQGNPAQNSAYPVQV